MLMNSQPTFLNIKGNLYSFYLKNKKRLSEEFLDKTMRQKKRGKLYRIGHAHTYGYLWYMGVF